MFSPVKHSVNKAWQCSICRHDAAVLDLAFKFDTGKWQEAQRRKRFGSRMSRILSPQQCVQNSFPVLLKCLQKLLNPVRKCCVKWLHFVKKSNLMLLMCRRICEQQSQKQNTYSKGAGTSKWCRSEVQSWPPVAPTAAPCCKSKLIRGQQLRLDCISKSITCPDITFIN